MATRVCSKNKHIHTHHTFQTVKRFHQWAKKMAGARRQTWDHHWMRGRTSSRWTRTCLNPGRRLLVRQRYPGATPMVRFLVGSSSRGLLSVSTNCRFHSIQQVGSHLRVCPAQRARDDLYIVMSKSSIFILMIGFASSSWRQYTLQAGSPPCPGRTRARRSHSDVMIMVTSRPLHFVPELSEFFIDFVTSSALGGRACVQMKLSAS